MLSDFSILLVKFVKNNDISPINNAQNQCYSCDGGGNRRPRWPILTIRRADLSSSLDFLIEVKLF